MRKTTLALATLAMLITAGTAFAWSSVSDPIRAGAIQADQPSASSPGTVRFLDSVPTWGHAGRIKANEDLYRQQVQEAQDARMRGQMMQMERDLPRAGALESESRISESDEYRAGRPGKFRSGSGRYDFVMPGPPRVGPPPPPPPRPPKSSTAPRDLYATDRELPPPPPPPPRPPR